jgi:RNA polymerase sigma factor (sigma-70 family)
MAGSRAENVLRHLQHLLGASGAPLDDARLLERYVIHHDQDAFAELVARHGPLVFGLCRRVLRDAHDAEDVFQATFLVLARKAAAIRKPQSLSCWLHGVAYRLAVKAKVEADKRHEHERRASPVRQSQDPDLSWSDVRGLIDEELQRLPQTLRLPLVLCYLQGETQDEAARRLGWPRGTLKRRLERGRHRLRIRLIQRGVTLGAGLLTAALTESAMGATIPTVLKTITVRAGMLFTTQEVGAITATRAALLAKGALSTMLTTKLKLGVMLGFLLGCAVTAAVLAIQPTPATKQPEKKAAAPAPARPVENEQVRNDRHGDTLPEGALARLGTMRLRHQDMTSSAVFIPDGKTAIVGDGRGNLVYWDVATGRELQRLTTTPSVIHALAISADGKMLASGSWGQVCFWDVASGQRLSTMKVNNDSVMQMLLTPDGNTLALRGQNNVIYLWDRVGNKKLHELKGHTGHVSSISLSSDGKTLVSGSWKDPYIRLWDVATGKEKLQFKAYDRDVVNVAFRPDGKVIASTGNGGGLRLWEPTTGKKLHDQTATVHLPMQLVYSPDGKLLAGSDGAGHLHIYDGSTGKHLRQFDAAPRTMAGLTFSPDGKTIATFWGGANTFDLWDVAGGKLLHPDAGHRHWITSLAFSADGQRVFSAAGISDYALRVWDARTGEPCAQLDDNPNGVNGLALSPDGKLLAACGYNDNTIRLWNLATLQEARSFKGHTSVIVSVAWSADGKALVSGSYYDGTIRVWDTTTGKQRRLIQAKQEWIGDVVLSPDGGTVAAGGYRDGTIRLWSATSGEELRRIATPQNTVYTLAFSPDGSALASGGVSAGIHLWDLATGRALRHWETPQGQIGHLAFCRDGRTVVSGHSDASVRLWERATGQERACFRGHRGFIRAVAFSHDGRCVASGSDDTTILIWDASGGIPKVALTTERLQALWADLTGRDAGRAYRAIWQMALAPKQALPFLAVRLRPVAPLEGARQQQVERLLADLDNELFTVRQQAERDLENMGPQVEPALRQALTGKPSLETRRRIEKVLENVAGWSGERLRALRALESIEHMNTPEARRLIDQLAQGDSRVWLTREARAFRARSVP